MGIVIFRGPGAARVKAGAGHGGESPHHVNLYVSLLFPGHHREAAPVVLDHFEAGRRAELASRQSPFWHDYVVDVISARCLGKEDFPIGSEIHPPGIAAFGGYLFQRAPVGFETNDALCNWSEMFEVVTRVNVTPAVTHGRINPSVERPAQVADDCMRVTNAETGI